MRLRACSSLSRVYKRDTSSFMSLLHNPAWCVSVVLPKPGTAWNYSAFIYVHRISGKGLGEHCCVRGRHLSRHGDTARTVVLYIKRMPWGRAFMRAMVSPI